MEKRFFTFAVVLILAAAVVGGLIGRQTASPDRVPRVTTSLFDRLEQVQTLIRHRAATPPAGEEMAEGAVRGLVRTLDPHSNFFDPDEFQKLTEENTGHYYGLGVRIRSLSLRSGRCVIIEPPRRGTPAYRAGLRAGDVICRVNGQSLEGLSLNDVTARLVGDRGTTVSLTVIRGGETAPLKFVVQREEIPSYSINHSFRIRPDIGYIKIDLFAESTHRELVRCLKRLDADSLSGLILDLRDNPGGNFIEAIKVCREFLPRGAPIVSTRGRDGREGQRFTARETGNLDLPLVVLINSGSASAAEIVSGALQDNDRGLIIGERSFGKGLVQTVYPLDDGCGLALTTSKYYTPSGRCLQRPFNGSRHEYYWLRSDKATPTAEREVRYTLSGRKVYGGGGITPDISVTPRSLNRFEITLYSRDVFFRFIDEAFQNKWPPLLGHLPEAHSAGAGYDVDEAIMAGFEAFLRRNTISYSLDDLKTNRDAVRRALKAEIVTRLAGVDAGFRVRADGDYLIRKALELIPEARLQLLRTREILATRGLDSPRSNSSNPS